MPLTFYNKYTKYNFYRTLNATQFDITLSTQSAYRVQNNEYSIYLSYNQDPDKYAQNLAEICK